MLNRFSFLVRSPALQTVAVVLLFDAIQFFIQQPINTFAFETYCVSIAMSFLLWFWLEEISLHLPRAFHNIFPILVALFITSLLVTNYFLYNAFRQYITSQMLAFVVDDKEYLLNYLQTYLFNGKGFIFLLLVVSWWFVWKRKKNVERKKFSLVSFAVYRGGCRIFLLPKREDRPIVSARARYATRRARAVKPGPAASKIQSYRFR